MDYSLSNALVYSINNNKKEKANITNNVYMTYGGTECDGCCNSCLFCTNFNFQIFKQEKNQNKDNKDNKKEKYIIEYDGVNGPRQQTMNSDTIRIEPVVNTCRCYFGPLCFCIPFPIPFIEKTPIEYTLTLENAPIKNNTIPLLNSTNKSESNNHNCINCYNKHGETGEPDAPILDR